MPEIGMLWLGAAILLCVGLRLLLFMMFRCLRFYFLWHGQLAFYCINNVVVVALNVSCHEESLQVVLS